MDTGLLVVLGIICGSMVLFIGGWIRYDMVALLALLFISFLGILSPEELFLGFGHPAVVTVGCVLVVSRGLLNAGVVDVAAGLVSRAGDRIIIQVATLTGLVALSSAFMNNVGALSLFIPVALTMSKKSGTPPSTLLMPLAFGSLLGGMSTLIGTPPNIIIATFRGQLEGTAPFRMFDFTPVGGLVALMGLTFITLVGWRLMPQRKDQSSTGDIIEIADYIMEVKVSEKSKAIGKRLTEIVREHDEVVILSMIRGEEKYHAPSRIRVLQPDDILIIKADPEDIQSFLDENELEPAESGETKKEDLGSNDIGLLEVVVMPDSFLEGKTARGLKLAGYYGVNLLAVARAGRTPISRVGGIRLKAGDVLLLQGETSVLHELIPRLGCLPLAERKLRLGRPRRILLALGIFTATIITTALGLVPVQISFLAAAFMMIMVGFVSLKDAYESIDWPVIILLGAMFPLSRALEVTGGTELIAGGILELTMGRAPWVALAVVFVGTMFLSDLVNNTAATVLMAPIAIAVARGLGVSWDPFLMAVAISASCAFLTPIGHQSNTLVMGPGGYRFGDYWRMGLPLEFLIVVTALPLLMVFWPLH